MSRPLTEKDLIYAAYARCPCGAGMAYERGIGSNGFWDCSDILLERAKREVKHEAQLPFIFYEIKSERQPSADGATTRPSSIEKLVDSLNTEHHPEEFKDIPPDGLEAYKFITSLRDDSDEHVVSFRDAVGEPCRMQYSWLKTLHFISNEHPYMQLSPAQVKKLLSFLQQFASLAEEEQ